MRSEMEKRYGCGEDLSTRDREPIYRAAIEEAKGARSIPQLRPVEENILYAIDSYGDSSLGNGMKFRNLTRLMQERFGWNLSITLGAINSLVDKGLLHDAGIFYDSSFVSKPSESSMNEDERNRSRETSFVLTDYAKNGFLNKDIRGNRTGRNIHWSMMRHLIRYYRERKGFSCIVDYGESNNRAPDIIVYPLITTFAKDKDDETIKEIHDPNRWDVKNRFAIEVETWPRKSQKQLMKNYEKSCSPPGQYSRVIFYVASEKHLNDVLDLLKTKPRDTYEVKLLDPKSFGVSQEELEESNDAHDSD
jgi:hypothetical protein